MTMRGEEFGTAVSLEVGDEETWSPSAAPDPVDWKFLYEQAQARAEQAEARCEELRWSEVQARSRASLFESIHKRNRAKLNAAREELKEVRRTSKGALALQAEVDRLRKLLADAGVEARKRSTILSLRMENAELQAEVKTLQAGIAELEKAVETLRSNRVVLSNSLYGRRSEQQRKPRSERKRGQQPGAAGHGRTRRPNLEETEERRDPPRKARRCSGCGQPYVAHGARTSEVIEIEVKAHRRKIIRSRWRRGCDCVSSPPEVTAPPPVRLFAGTPYGISVWTRILYERYACLRPCRRVAEWLTGEGLAISPGTLADSTRRLLPLFEPLYEAILAHQNTMTLRHADETSWRIQALGEIGRSRRAWLWTSVSTDAVYFHIDPSRSAEAARKLFTGTTGPVYLVCDRYSAYRKLARELGGKVILCLCWAYVAARTMLRSVWTARSRMQSTRFSAT